MNRYQDDPVMRNAPVARVIADVVTEAVRAAQTADPEAFTLASTKFTGMDAEQLRVVLGAVVRSLLEDQHPDGLSGDDLQLAIETSLRLSATWFPDADPNALVIVLTGALGIHDEEQAAAPSVMVICQHAILLIAALVNPLQLELDPYLAAAFAEVARAETVEQP